MEYMQELLDFNFIYVGTNKRSTDSTFVVCPATVNIFCSPSLKDYKKQKHRFGEPYKKGVYLFRFYPQNLVVGTSNRLHGLIKDFDKFLARLYADPSTVDKAMDCRDYSLSSGLLKFSGCRTIKPYYKNPEWAISNGDGTYSALVYFRKYGSELSIDIIQDKWSDDLDVIEFVNKDVEYLVKSMFKDIKEVQYGKSK